ncbi:MAG: thiolase [Chloroflexi bacterium]|nr:thiolase [Chloroflexota bacterium]
MAVSKAAAIVGIFEHPTRHAPDKTILQLQAECILGALADAGIDRQEVDGLFVPDAGAQGRWIALCDYLGITPQYADTTALAGPTAQHLAHHAVAAIAAGLINVAVVAQVSKARTGRGSGRQALAPVPDSFQEPYGPAGIGLYALAATRHMYQYGTTHEQLAEIAVACRTHAANNPDAVQRRPIAVEDVLNSRWIQWPLHLLDCCLVTDAGGAVVIVAADRARHAHHRPVWILGTATFPAHTSLGWRDITTSAAARSAPIAYAQAGVTPRDIDMAMVADHYSHTALILLEDAGFCKKGEGGPFVAGGRIQIGGALPINTDGGGLSSAHGGFRGMQNLIEGTRQIRGSSHNQVLDCTLVLCQEGGGGGFGVRHTAATTILGRD